MKKFNKNVEDIISEEFDETFEYTERKKDLSDLPRIDIDKKRKEFETKPKTELNERKNIIKGMIELLKMKDLKKEKTKMKLENAKIEKELIDSELETRVKQQRIYFNKLPDTKKELKELLNEIEEEISFKNLLRPENLILENALKLRKEKINEKLAEFKEEPKKEVKKEQTKKSPLKEDDDNEVISITQKKKCKDYDYCNLIKLKEHRDKYYHKCLDKDCKRKDESHTNRFVHVCKYGKSCTKKDSSPHCYQFTH